VSFGAKGNKPAILLVDVDFGKLPCKLKHLWP
jgi:hypothetical protein